MILTIALSQLDSKEHIHDLMADMLDLPEYYGRNLDALYDVLTTLEEKMTIVLDFEGRTLGELPKVTLSCLRVLYDAAYANPRLRIEHDQRDLEQTV